jgi:hypothetical protein
MILHLPEARFQLSRSEMRGIFFPELPLLDAHRFDEDENNEITYR